ncbi:MAG: HAD family hydrolase, partial [Anaerolineaceae bacterium]|nr:HAD family hydrolase [Anaerolineaceae bacterium]
MTEKIEGILFDMGGTLRSTVEKSRSEKEEAIRGIVELLDAEIPIVEFSRMLMERAKAYKDWADQTLIELNEQDLWTKWMLPDWPVERIRPVAVQLNQMFRDSFGTRTIFPETRDVVLELYRRGYHLGLVSNTTSSVEVPAALKALRMAGCFDVVILSTVVGKRKPDPSILQDAAERMGISPNKCVYVGDQPKRDVAAARNAGFSKTVILSDPEKQSAVHAEDPAHLPDHKIGNLKELLDIFPPREPVQPSQQYSVSLSTMWAVKNFPTLPDFFEFARRAGFARIELNHQVNTALLAGIDLSRYSFSSIHEPCPADIPMDTLVERDWQI